MGIPKFTLEVAPYYAWNDGSSVALPTGDAVNFVDLASDLESLSVTRGAQSEDDPAQTGALSATLLDDIRKYDPNLFSLPNRAGNPSFEVDTSGWGFSSTGPAPAGSVTTANGAKAGSKAALWSATAAGAAFSGAVFSQDGNLINFARVNAGEVWYLSCWVKNVEGVSSISLNARANHSGFAYLSTTSLTGGLAGPVNPAVGVWTFLEGWVVVPVNAFYLGVEIDFNCAGTGNPRLAVDSVMVTPAQSGNGVRPLGVTYIDGDTSGTCHWSGTPHASWSWFGSLPNLTPMKHMRVRATLADRYTTVLNAHAPSLYWRLGEAPAVSTAADSSGNGRTGTYGGGATRGFSGAVTADPTTSARFNDSSSGIVSSAYSPFVVGSKRTFMGWAYRDTTSGYDCLFGGSHTFPGTTLIEMPPSSQDVNFYANSAALTWAAAWPGTVVWVHWALTYDDSTGVAELFINGVSKGTRSFGSANNYSGTGGTFTLGGFPGALTTEYWGGAMQDVAVFERVLSLAEIQDIYGAATQTLGVFRGFVDIQNAWIRDEHEAGYDYVTTHANDGTEILNIVSGGFVHPFDTTNQLTGTRVSQILDKTFGSGLPRRVDAGTVTLIATATGYSSGGFNQLTGIRDAELVDLGFFFFAGDGTAVFQDGAYRAAHTTPLATLCDVNNLAANRVLYDRVTTRRSTIINSVTATRVGGSAQTAGDNTSQATYVTRPASYSTQHVSDADALTFATNKVNSRKTSKETLESVTIVPGNDSLAWSVVLGRELGDRVQVIRTPAPASTQNPNTADYVIIGIALTFGPGIAAECTWRLAAL